MSKYIQALCGLAIALDYVKGTKGKKAEATVSDALIALGSPAVADDLQCVEALIKCWDNEDMHAKSWGSGGLAVWLDACGQFPLDVAVHHVVKGAEVVMLDGRAGLKTDTSTKLAPHNR